jgi:DamX protein
MSASSDQASSDQASSDQASSDQGKTEQDLAGYLHSESPRRPEQHGVVDVPSSAPPGLSELPEGDIRDMEKSLVERIADVDDDRRRTAVQLRKAFETHRDDIRAQRRRDHTALLTLMGIGIVLLAGMVLLFTQLLQARNALEARIAALEARPAVDAPTGSIPSALSADAAAALGTRIDALEQQARPTVVPAAAVDESATDDADEAATEQVGELADAIESIADRLTALEGSTRDPPAAAVDGSEPQADTEAVASAAERRVAELEARLGALLDERLASVEARIDEVRHSIRATGGDEPSSSAAPANGTGTGTAEPPTGAETMTTPASMIVLQLAGLPSRDAVARFMDRHEDLPAEIYVKSDTRRGQAWYGVIHSLHANMEAAEAALAALPTDLAALDTWLRPLSAGTPLEVLSTRP